jgi:capsid protein
VYRDWIDIAALKGAVKLDGGSALTTTTSKWRGRGWKWVDPKNDIEAVEKEVKLGINTRTNAAAEQGRDYEENIDEIELELDYADSTASTSASP